MEIEVKIYIVNTGGPLKAFASATLDKEYCVNGLRVLKRKGTEELWVAMPSTKNKRGEFRDVFHPINKDSRQELSDAVLKAHQMEIATIKKEEKTKVDARTN